MSTSWFEQQEQGRIDVREQLYVDAKFNFTVFLSQEWLFYAESEYSVTYLLKRVKAFDMYHCQPYLKPNCRFL